MAVLLAVASIPVMRAADPPTHPKGPRISSLDGLRGFLAFAVFFHHAAISHEYWSDGHWTLPPSRFYALLGQLGVSVFFMITAYLFWTKLLKDGGRPNWIQLYTGRVFRIGPVYLVAAIWMLLLLFWKTRFTLHEPLGVVVRETAGWLALGMVWPHIVNGYAQTRDLVAGVTWTLFFEWIFYFSLLFTAIPIRRRANDLLCTGGALTANTVYLLLTSHSFTLIRRGSLYAEFFLIGMTCASLEKRGLVARMPRLWSSVLGGLFVGFVFLTYDDVNNAAIPALFLGAAFYLIVSGCDFFGLLTAIPARRLGNVSYGVYLLQGLILMCLLSLPPVRRFFLASPLHHWATMMGAAIILLAVATVVHVFVEDPGIDLGRRLSGQFERVKASRKT
jgi:peptidoglycan/LPS O-acetylase OafA/YrhL